MKSTLFGFLFVFFSILHPTSSFGAKLSANEGIERIINEHHTKGLTFLQLFKHYHNSDFINPSEWDKFVKKLSKSKLVNSRSDFPELCFEIADKYCENQKYQDAYYFLYITLNEQPNVKHSSLTYLAKFHERIAHTYYYFRRFDLSEKHFKYALKHPSISDQSKIKVFNTLSLIYREKNDSEKSKHYLLKAYHQAERIKDTVWLGILSGNLGYILFQNKEYDKAKELIEFDYVISAKNDQRYSQLHSLALLIDINLAQDNISEAYKDLTLFDSLIEPELPNELLMAYYKVKTLYFEKVGQYKQAMDFFKKYMKYKEVVDSERQFLNLENAQFQIEFEKKQGENIAFKEKKKKDDLIILGLFIICFIVGVTSFIIIKQIQRKRFQDKELLEFRAQEVEKELVETEREMRSLLSTMFDKNKVISELQEQVDSFEQNQNSKTAAEKEAMLNDLQSFSLFSENDWVKFKRLFEKLNPGFFDYFRTNFPGITSAELRLTALIKLNLTNLEIARTLAISPDSVRKTNLRLRKKLKIDSVEQLDKFINTVRF